VQVSLLKSEKNHEFKEINEPIKNEGYMNQLMKMTLECKKVTEKLILTETQTNLQKNIINSYKMALESFNIDPTTFRIGAAPYKIKQRYQLRDPEFEKLTEATKNIENLYEKLRKINCDENNGNEVIILNESVFDEYSQYYSRYKSPSKYKTKNIESEPYDFGSNSIGIQCVLCYERGIEQEIQAFIPTKEIKKVEFSNENPDNENTEKLYETVKSLREDRNQYFQ